MERIKFIADTASDIPDADLQKYHIEMPSVPITVDGIGYYERRSFSIDEFYGVLQNATEIPATSRIPAEDYLTCYQRAHDDGYTDFISVTINSAGSGTNASAQMARELFFQKNPGSREKVRIHIVDSRSYSLGYGYPVILAAQMAREGKTVREILAFFDDWFARAEIYLGCYSLEYAKKSGRIGAASAFVGDILGLRPVISMIGGETKVVAKVRGDKQVVPQLLKSYEDSGAAPEDPVVIVYGEEEYYGQRLKEALEDRLGREIPTYRAGASIIINSGPRMAALVSLAPKRRPVAL